MNSKFGKINSQDNTFEFRVQELTSELIPSLAFGALGLTLEHSFQESTPDLILVHCIWDSIYNYARN